MLNSRLFTSTGRVAVGWSQLTLPVSKTDRAETKASSTGAPFFLLQD